MVTATRQMKCQFYWQDKEVVLCKLEEFSTSLIWWLISGEHVICTCLWHHEWEWTFQLLAMQRIRLYIYKGHFQGSVLQVFLDVLAR